MKGTTKAHTNCSLWKITERKVEGKWVQFSKVQMKWSRARGRGNTRAKRKRNPNRIDVKVVVPGWGRPMWHRLLGWYYHHTPGLTRRAFEKKEVDHTNRNPQRIDFRRLEIVEPQRGL